VRSGERKVKKRSGEGRVRGGRAGMGGREEGKGRNDREGKVCRKRRKEEENGRKEGVGKKGEVQKRWKEPGGKEGDTKVGRRGIEGEKGGLERRVEGGIKVWREDWEGGGERELQKSGGDGDIDLGGGQPGLLLKASIQSQ